MTIKNPGDVRVRQWRDVENKLGTRPIQLLKNNITKLFEKMIF